MNTTWSVRIDRLRTRLRVGVHADELEPQAVSVTLRLRGVAAACPHELGECLDYEPLCRWVTDEWPRTPHTALLETRINELVTFVFGLDPRVQEARIRLTKQRMSRQAAAVGIERCVSRPQFEAQQRHTPPATLRTPPGGTHDERQLA